MARKKKSLEEGETHPHDLSLDSFIISARGHIGKLIDRLDPIEAMGFALGGIVAAKNKLALEQGIVLAFTGAFAARGLSSDSEAIGIASLVTLAALGAGIGVPDIIGEMFRRQEEKTAAAREIREELLAGKISLPEAAGELTTAMGLSPEAAKKVEEIIAGTPGESLVGLIFGVPATPPKAPEPGPPVKKIKYE